MKRHLHCKRLASDSPAWAAKAILLDSKECLRVKEYDLFLPLRYNDGTPIEAIKFRVLQSRLLEYFNGVTFFPQPSQGLWKAAGVTYRDEIVIYRVVTGSVRSARQFLRRLKEELKAALQQEEIFIVERDVRQL